MGKRVWAILIKRILLGIVVVFLVGVAFDEIFYPSGSQTPFLAGLIAIAIYATASAAMWIINLVTGALYLWLFADKDLADAVVEELHIAKIAPPRAHDPKNFDYLAVLADDESENASERVKAAFLYANYKAIMGNGIFRPLAMRKAIDAGILRYAQEAPQRQSP